MPASTPSTSKKYFVIGKAPGYNDNINQTYDYENDLLPHLTFIDLIPRTLKYNSGVTSDLKNFVNNVLTYEDEDHPMKYFNQVMQKHSAYLDAYNPGAKYDGIRLVATIDSAINNSVSHTYEANMLDNALNGTKNIVTGVADKATGGVASKIVKGVTDANTIYKMLSGKQYDANRDLKEWSSFLDAFAGYRIHMPKMWTGTSVQDILQLSVKLTSPSGDPKSIKRYIIEPLVILFIMSTPLSVTGTDLGTPFIYEVHAHGMGNYKLAGITNINFDRGGTDTDFNVYQQPLTVNARISIMPLATDAVTALGEPTFYDKAWFQTPKNIFDSLQPKEDIANEVLNNIFK